MAAAETLRITRDINDTVKDVDQRLVGVDESVQGVDRLVKGVDHKVGSVMEGVKDTGVAIQQVVNQVCELNRNELRKDLRKWITPPNPSVNYNAACGAHHEGTASWCNNGNTLAYWKASGSLLWIHGKPGSGKSILSSVIIRHFKSMFNAESTFLAYFYFDFKDTAKQDCRALLSSLLIQLSDQSDILCDTLFTLYSAHKRGSEQPTDDSLARCLKDMFAIIGHVPIYFIMDALDECPNDSGIPSLREKVLELVKELVELHHPSLRLCVTSRPEFDIRTTLEPLATQQVSLHDESGQTQDINHYITSVIHSDKKMKRWRDDDKNMVIDKLTKKADGMFRWVFCQLEVLRVCFPANLRRTLEELPKSLDGTYGRILKEINNANRDLAYLLLQCLAVAIRPLRVEELTEVLTFDLSTGGIPKLIPDWRWEDQEEAVLSACSSLVSVIVDGGSRVVQFSHFSVKEFLTSDRLASSTEGVSGFHVPLEPAHTTLAHACLGALLRLEGGTTTYNTRAPLVQYAAENWITHAQFEDVELRMKDAMGYFFDTDKPHFSAWIQIHDVDSGLAWHVDSRTPLYYAAHCGFHNLVEHLILKYPQHVSAQGGHCGTPLHAALSEGHIEIAKLLIEHGADVNALDDNHWTPLHFASQFGHLDAVKWLLAHGASPNSQNYRNYTPLHYSVLSNHFEISRKLLELEADVNSRTRHRSTPLLLAAQYGPPDLVQLFLDHNADVYVQDNNGDTPLHCAVVGGQLEVARILLKLNVDVNSRNNRGSTPLHLVSEGRAEGKLDIVRLLLDHGADAQVRNLQGRTASEVARDPRQREIVQLISQHAAK